MADYTGTIDYGSPENWGRMMKRQDVILKALQGELTWIQVAEVLGVSARQVRRLKQAYERMGIEGLLDRRHGAAKNRAPKEVVELVCRLYREQYFDYNVKHFHEKLQALHGVKQSYPCILGMLQNARLVEKHRTRDKHRKRRERRPMPGMMIHLDGSDHPWVEYLGEDAPRWDLLATLDDATNEVYAAFFAEEEDTRSVLRILHKTTKKCGIFCSLYTDRAVHFVVTLKAGERPDTGTIRTQCQRALDQLGVKLIPANSPQARGRGERLWKTFQGRLPQEHGKICEDQFHHEANAALIAASPEMLEVLKSLASHADAAVLRLKSQEHFESFAADLEKTIRKARNLAAKAEGRTK